MRLLVLVLLAFIACVKSNAIECGDGRVCPFNTTCDVARGLCLLPGQLEACAGTPEGAPCEFGGVAGACYMGLCVMSTCGDSRIGPGEVCDDGNLASVDGCRADCRSDETCGNGLIDFQVEEECDCGAEGTTPAMGCDATNSMTNEAATCRSDCKLRCGDQMVQPGEVCDGSAPYERTCLDYGFDTGVLACSDVCGPSFVGCTQFGWVPVDPGQTAVELRAVWGADTNNIFAVGMLGTILKWDGVAWSKMVVPPATTHLYAIWGRSATDVYAVGNFASVLHYDGTTWTAMTTGLSTSIVFKGITGNATNLYLAGTEMADPPVVEAGIVVRFNNNQWTTAFASGTAKSLNTIAIHASRSEVIAAGQAGDIWRASIGSSSWTDVAGTASGNLYGSFTTGNDVYAVGDDGLFRSTSGSTFVEVGTFQGLRSIWGTSATNIFLLGDRALHWDGSTSTVASLGFVPNEGVWGTAIDNVWTVGTSIRHFEGTTWVETTTGVSTDLNAITAGPPGIFAVGDQGEILRFASGAWGPTSFDVTCGSTYSTELTGVFAGTNVVVASAIDGTLLYGDAGSAFSFKCGLANTPKALYDVWAISSTLDAFAASDGATIYRRPISTTTLEWTAMPAVVWNGATPFPLPRLETIWGFAENDIFAGGNNGTIVHWNGVSWTQMPTMVVSGIADIWGSAPNDVFAVGSLGTILHYDGTSWTQMTTNTVNQLEAVWGTSGTDVFATGGDTLLHYDGSTWLPVRDATLSSIRDIVGQGPRLFGVGSSGGAEILLRY